MFRNTYLSHKPAEITLTRRVLVLGKGSRAGTAGGMAYRGTPHLSAHGYRSLFYSLFGLTVFFSAIDLVSTWVALGQGFSEANSIMIAIGNFTGLGLIGALGLTKVLFIIGSGFVAALGIRTSNRTLRTRALIVLSFLAVMLIAVSVNNLYWITS
jgi:hypothetical protein